MQMGFRAERSLGYVQITDLSTAQPLTIPPGCTLVLVTPEVAAVRWRDDGTAPTATVGYPLAVGGELQYSATRMEALRFIQQTAGAIINVAFYGS